MEQTFSTDLQVLFDPLYSTVYRERVGIQIYGLGYRVGG